MTIRKLAASALCLATLCFSGLAHAQTVWSAAAISCVPDDDTIKFNAHRVTRLGLRHRANSTEKIVMVCPLPPFAASGTDWTFGMSYRDQTGTAFSGKAQARLLNAGRASGLGNLSVSVLSDDYAVTTRNTVDVPFTHTFDFETKMYWVEIEMERTLTTQEVVVYSVYIAAPAS